MGKNFDCSRLAALRKKNGISGEALAKFVNLTQGFISALERGEKSPSIETVVALANALGTSVAYLVGEIDDPRITAMSLLHDHSLALKTQASAVQSEKNDGKKIPDKKRSEVSSVNNGNVEISETRSVKDTAEMAESGNIIFEREEGPKKTRIVLPPTEQSYAFLQQQMRIGETVPPPQAAKHEEDGDVKSALFSVG